MSCTLNILDADILTKINRALSNGIKLRLVCSDETKCTSELTTLVMEEVNKYKYQGSNVEYAFPIVIDGDFCF